MCFSALVKRASKELGALEVRTDFELHDERTRRDPKVYPPIAARIFPDSFTSIAYNFAGKRVASPARYNVHPPWPGAERLTRYNARRNNLHAPYWAEAFGRNHGILIIEGFYEWVAVADLLRAGVVGINDIRQEFEKQTEARRQRVLASGRKYAPTKTELTDARFRRIIIEFRAQHDLLVPVIFTQRQAPDGGVERGFAIVTDDPPEEVAGAGHDRCPVPLAKAAVDEWLTPEGKTQAELVELLGMRDAVTFQHVLDKGA